MISFTKRKNFLKKLVLGFALITSAILLSSHTLKSQEKIQKPGGSKLKISLNSYSFNDPLRNGSITLSTLLDICAINDFDAVDLTAYYFPGYPAVPADSFIYALKKKAFLLGVDISGTGVRNDFTNPDKNKRNEDIILVKKWIEVAEKLGAPVIRIFSGTQIPAGFTWEQVMTWMVKDIKECVAYGKQHGVIVAIQNHDDFIKTADQAQKIIEAVNSEWFGLVLDIGSYRIGDPYKQIEQTVKYAVNWQLKENMYVNGAQVKTDLNKVIGIIKASGYRGYVPIETLGAGDPAIKVPQFLAKVRKALEQPK